MNARSVRAFGAAAAVLEVDGAGGSDTARRANAWRRAILAARPGLDVVAGGDRVLVAAPIDDVRALLGVLDEGRELEGRALDARASTHVIDVVYDGEDLADVSARAGVPTDRLIKLHADVDYSVEVVGFLPGFGYLGEVPAELRVARRATPRPRVPAGSVAIAGRYAGIYPFSSPGGWHLLGRAIEPALFDPTRDRPARFAPGDRVRFRPVSAGARASVIDAEPAAAGDLEIVRVTPHATVQDLGREGLRGAGVPTSGAWDRATHIRTNRAVGNPDDAATIELPFGGLVATALRALEWSVDGEVRRRASAGDRIEIPPSSAALRYLGVAGGIDVPTVLGSRSTLVTAGFGGHRGRRLRPGDRLPIGLPSREPVLGTGTRHAIDATTSVRVAPGPDLADLPAGTLDHLFASEWTLSSRVDRTGARLEGPTSPNAQSADRAPRPTIPGAVQITPDGTPIVLGPDAAVTGGYPVALVVDPDGRSALARLRPGARLRFDG